MADNQDSTSPPWWTLARMLVWILLQVDLPPQDAAQFCSELNPKTIEVALNALVGALFNALYGAVEGMPIVAARIRRGSRYEDLADFFQSPPSLESGALDALRNELRQFIRQQPDIQFNPTWGRWTWPVRVSAAQTAPTSTRPSESAVADEAKPIPGSAVGPEEPQSLSKPDSGDASTPAVGPARSINVGYVDPAIAHALAHAIKRARPAVPPPEPATEDVGDEAGVVTTAGETDEAKQQDDGTDEAEHTRWQRDRTIEAMKTLLPPDGIRPKGMSIKKLTDRINKLSEFKEDKVSEDTVRLAHIEIKAALKK
jgi:hypothetical protein